MRERRQRPTTGVMAAALPPRVRGVMTPPYLPRDPHLLHPNQELFEDRDLHAELRLTLWTAVAVLLVMLYLAHVAGIAP